jgi:hypothetical protein
MMIKLTPREVESCRRLKYYTERRLAEELYEAIEKPKDKQTHDFLKGIREMCKDALLFLIKITELLQKSRVKDGEAINKMLRKAGPLSVYYAIEDASSDLKIKNDRFKEIDDYKEDKIKDYKEKIRTLERAERELNKNINTLLYKIEDEKKTPESGDFNACELKDSVKNVVSPETQKIIDSNNLLIEVLSEWEKDDLERWMVIEGCEDDDGYFVVKKNLDLEIARLYNKIEWQNEYAESLKRQATSDNCDKKLEITHLNHLLVIYEELSPSDCSDIFRLLGTMMEELDKLDEEKDWSEINKHCSTEDLDKLKFSIEFQTILRETSGLDVQRLFPDMPPKLANTLTMPDQYQIDWGEKLVKYCEECGKEDPQKGVKDVSTIENDETVHLYYECGQHEYIEEVKYGDYKKGSYTKEPICRSCKNPMSMVYVEYDSLDIGHDLKNNKWVCIASVHGIEDIPLTNRIAQKLRCLACNEQVELYFKPAKHAKEKSAESKCPECGADAKFQPVGGVKPFWKDEIRARWRDTWSSTFILEYNSVVRTIDRTFGLPEGADISGTTADSIFGMEILMAAKGGGEKSIGTGEVLKLQTIEDKNRDWERRYLATGGYPGYLILLPLITMVKHGHHAILECALTYALNDYIDAYHIGYYTSLWPKRSAQTGRLWEILQKWENSPSNKHIIIERDKDGFVTGGWLFDKDSYLTDGYLYGFREVSKLDYQRYINIFLPLRDRMKLLDKIEEDDDEPKREEDNIDVYFIEGLMVASQEGLYMLQLEILEKNAEKLKKWAEENNDYKDYNDFAEGLEEYAAKRLEDEYLSRQLAELSREYRKKELAPV